MFWTDLWKQNGCPNQDHIANIRRSTRTRYHRAIKFIKKNSDLLIKYKIANCLTNKRFSNFWNEVRKIKKPNTINFVTLIDEGKGSNNFVNQFKNHYEQLYNSFPDKNSKIKNEICNNISKCITGECVGPHKYELKNITNAVSKLKNDQKDYIYEMFTDNFINRTNKQFNALNVIFNSILSHGCTNNIFNKSVIIPLVKNNRVPLKLFTNYRALTLGSTICKIFEFLILNIIDESIKSKIISLLSKKNTLLLYVHQ